MAAALDTTAKREGHKAMEKTLSAAAQVRRAFRAGPPRRKDLFLAPGRAVTEAWALLDDLQTTMRRLGLAEDDARARLVVMTPNTPEGEDSVYAFPVPKMSGLPALYEKVMALAADANLSPLGVVFSQWDRDSDAQEPEVWTVPWLVFPAASSSLAIVSKLHAVDDPADEIVFSQAR